MTVYSINLGIGWSSSGVEYSQKYRNQLFQQINQPANYIFMDLILNENICHLTRNLGFKDEDILWPYLYFTDIPLGPTTYRVDQVIASLAYPVEEQVQDNDQVLRLVYDSGRQFARCYLSQAGSDQVDRVEFVYNNQLVRKEYYTDTCFLVEYFEIKDQSAQVRLRRFLNRDRTVAYEQYVNGDQVTFKMPDRILYSNEEFHAYFFEKIGFASDDVILLDRGTGTAQGLVSHSNGASIGVVVHAEHYSPDQANDNYILWNNYYEYQFTNYDLFDFYLVSTPLQKEVLASQFKHYLGVEPKIYVIPVGSVDQVRQPEGDRLESSMMTASRLASEKHIDWLVEAVAQAHQEVPSIQFDIYGEGGKKAYLQELITKLGADEYIRLKGHHHLEDVYKNYDLYLTASTSEGFGLTLLEAIASGLAMIGLDVPYGNPTFIDHEENGYLLPYENTMEKEEIVANLTQAIMRYFQEADHKQMAKHSYEIAEAYLDEEVAKQWQALIKEESHV
ncbi:accessory Sec system glycosyltransferase GtfA [Hutsoniella sourekii]|uniref:accessory Sec system glycosyltransferase GtfA n=1 Tax=Hutsoniella sourekii TaxID=87650 RepID=UPI000482E2EA|nr:accessory Sec system glycosyltransferase GtfA [Hutsoniella sourekii]